MSKDLNQLKALIFRITHRDNVAWILKNGLHCRNSQSRDPNFVNIGNPELIEKRTHRAVPLPPGGTLSDYVPFYFTPFSPMLYNIKTGYGGIQQRPSAEIVILVSSLYSLDQKRLPFVFTDRHAYLAAAQFYSNLARLDQIDWPSLQQRDFRRDHDDPSKFERYQAEALPFKRLPIDALSGIVCYNESVADRINSQIAKGGMNVKVVVRPAWYFR